MDAVLELAAEGLNNCEIARRTGIPRGTVKDWVRGKTPRRSGTSPYATGPACDRCGGDPHDPQGLPAPAYAYLLGLYLGDGYISAGRRGVYRLRITLDAKYPGIIEECAHAIAEVMPTNKVNVQKRHDGNCVEAGSFSKTLPCLFPQHGSGMKHTRRIRLVDWQEAIVERHSRELLRGLIHSDGCRFTNPIRHGDKLYTYPRYTFTNHSIDIQGLFCDACDRLDIAWTRPYWKTISVARRESVARMDEFVGPKF